MKREFLQLAHEFEFGKKAIGEWAMSEKIDGIRCFWDGGVTRTMYCANVPFANTTKHDRYLDMRYATGLWTRYGQPIYAPDWWIDLLPPIMLDGELTMGRQSWQETVSCVKKLDGTGNWNRVIYNVFDSPPLRSVFGNGEINNPNYKKKFQGVDTWIKSKWRGHEEIHPLTSFSEIYHKLCGTTLGGQAKLLDQVILPAKFSEAEDRIREELDRVTDLGGEGLMIRNGRASWTAGRVHTLLKVKKLHDCEGLVVGYKFGEVTDVSRSVSGKKTDKLVGLMGSLRVKLESGVELDLSGFTEAERDFGSTSVRELAESSPGSVAPEWVEHPQFGRGSKVTIRYREQTKDGCLKEARYLRPQL